MAKFFDKRYFAGKYGWIEVIIIDVKADCHPEHSFCFCAKDLMKKAHGIH